MELRHLRYFIAVAEELIRYPLMLCHPEYGDLRRLLPTDRAHLAHRRCRTCGDFSPVLWESR